MEEICLRLRAGLHIKSAKFPQHDFYLSCGSFYEEVFKMIGRTEKTKMRLSLLHEEEPQFIAVFGRRCIGKTYLVRESFH